MMYTDAIEKFFDDYTTQEGCRGECHENERFMLVERSTYDRTYFLTTWATPEDAAAYHDGQEFPEDWGIVLLEDMQTGARFYAVPHTTFEPMPEVP